jgi:hypothetical protein
MAIAGGRSAPSAGQDGDTGSDWSGPGQPRLTVVESQLTLRALRPHRPRVRRLEAAGWDCARLQQRSPGRERSVNKAPAETKGSRLACIRCGTPCVVSLCHCNQPGLMANYLCAEADPNRNARPFAARQNERSTDGQPAARVAAANRAARERDAVAMAVRTGADVAVDARLIGDSGSFRTSSPGSRASALVTRRC